MEGALSNIGDWRMIDNVKHFLEAQFPLTPAGKIQAVTAVRDAIHSGKRARVIPTDSCYEVWANRFTKPRG